MYTGKALCFVVFLNVINSEIIQSSGPNVLAVLRALNPKGFRAYITVNEENVSMLFFDGLLYDDMKSAINSGPLIRQIWGTGVKQAHGEWLFEDLDITLEVGMVLKYGIFIPNKIPTGKNKDGKATLSFDGNFPEYNNFKILALEDPSAPDPRCLPTVTKVRGKRHVCAGEVIFEDNFDTLREDLWQFEQYIPSDSPGHPFVSYQRLTSEPNVYVNDGALHIDLKLQQDLLKGEDNILSGHLDLTNGCTRSTCSKEASGADILPPIVSGRLISNPFSFKYGTVYVRAKLPIGDWLYPEILLEPMVLKYNKHDNKLRIPEILKILMNTKTVEFDSERCHFSNISIADMDWSYDFYNIELLWTPDVISYSLNGFTYFVWDQILADSPTNVVNVSILQDRYDVPLHLDCNPNVFAFDYLHLTLGIGVGGIIEFPDNWKYRGRGRSKPWRNSDPKACLRFWEALPFWLNTWSRPNLVVDYVKVVALAA